MNTPNNKRRRESVDKLERALVELLQTETLQQVTVSQLCQRTGLNRSTFYVNFLDIYDLADKLRHRLEQEFSDLFADYDYFSEHTGALRMFQHIKDNPVFYQTYFKLCYDEKHLISTLDPRRAQQQFQTTDVRYHVEFFRAGFNAIIKLWLENGCQESPEEMAAILKAEYRGR